MQSLPIAHADMKAAAPPEPLTLAYSTAVLCWLLSAGVYIAAKWVSPEMPPWALVLLAAGARLPDPAAGRAPPLRRDDRALLRTRALEVILVGTIGLTLCQGMIYTGLNYTDATTAGIIMALSPVMTMVLAPLRARRAARPVEVARRRARPGRHGCDRRARRSRRADAPSVQSGRIMDRRQRLLLGALHGAGAPRQIRHRASADAGAAARHRGADRPALAICGKCFAGERSALNANGLLALAYLAGPGGALMYYLYNRSVETLGAGRASMLLYLQTLFVAMLAFIFLGESLHDYDLAGAAFIVAGLVLANLIKSKPREAKPA